MVASIFKICCCAVVVGIEPDHGMEPGLAHHFFMQLINGVVSSRIQNSVLGGEVRVSFLFLSRSTCTQGVWLTEI